MREQRAKQSQDWSIDEIHAALASNQLMLSDLTTEQLAAWVTWEPPPVPLTGFDLGDEDHRRAFLWEYYWQGETTLFAAVAHVWDSLEVEREAHCTLVGSLSGAGGKGKMALVLTLQQFLRECLDVPPLIPQRSDFASMAHWHQAVGRQLAGDEAHARRLCVRYSAILDGYVPAVGKVIKGPWK